MTEPTRPIRQPTVESDGSLVAHTVATPKAFKVRALMTVPANRVIPVIFVPGIMGTNLRVRGNGSLPDGANLKPGEPAWRPPNSIKEGLLEAWNWSKRDPAQRQKILDPDLLEVDNMGALDSSGCSLTEAEMRERGWGEVHAGSYGSFLAGLQGHLDTTFELNGKQRKIKEHWQAVIHCDPARWGVREIDRLTEAELEKYAGFHYPVYAVGYNWLQSCAVSSIRLEKYIQAIIQHWIACKGDCKQVILVTHSMGGLVARACAKRMPDRIAGIIHGVMPALGAPVAYRRIACGTEGGSYGNDFSEGKKADKFAEIAGETADKTTAVMATAPGVLELLPNHLYPQPWLIVKTVAKVNKEEKYRDLLSLPKGNPYDFYRDMHSWYRMVNPALADPANKHVRSPTGVAGVIRKAIDAAEHFHTEVLATRDDKKESVPYYHPNTFAFYGADNTRRAFGQIRWVAREPAGQNLVLTQSNLRRAEFLSHSADGAREVQVEGRFRLQFRPWLQDADGDDTVPQQSGAGPAKYVGHIFATKGFSHQESFQDNDMLLLTQHLIVKIVQGFK
jgi:hypothetical protein